MERASRDRRSIRSNNNDYTSFSLPPNQYYLTMKKLVVVVVASWVFWFSLYADVNHASSRPISDSPTISPNSGANADSPGVMMMENQQHHHYMKKKLVVALIVVSSTLATILSSLLCFCIYRFKTRKHHNSSGVSILLFSKFHTMKRSDSTNSGSAAGSVSIIEYPLLEAATNNFHENNVVGQGGFGCVYKACFDNHMLAAVKRMNTRGQSAETEFQNEVHLLSKFRHPNIVSLLGYCIHGNTRFIVYQLMQNGSLETQLHGPSHGSALNWHMRMKIALDAARGLEYLHENCNPPVIHRDLKSSNILLDSNFNAKLSDFGLAVISGTQNKNSIKLSGTLGYVAPEYLLDGKLTDKSDVYAFGVILLELLMGRKPVEKMTPSQCHSIVTWAMPQLTDRAKLPNIVDPVIRNTMDVKHLYQVAAVAVLCVQPEPSYRPLITDVLHSLTPLVPLVLGGTLRVAEPAHVINHSST